MNGRIEQVQISYNSRPTPALFTIKTPIKQKETGTDTHELNTQVT